MPDPTLSGARGRDCARFGVADGRAQVFDALIVAIGGHHDPRRILVDHCKDVVILVGQVGQSLPVHHRDLDRSQPDGVAVRCRV